ncbi:MAG: class I SAM-dependent methyltransferase [Elusimicrobiota bacterium]|nr:class I SAM-dependent methyltransferase [Elusimicrobiota bacterium]
MIDVLSHNRESWDKQAADGNRWTIPVDAARIARARAGDWTVDLTPRKPVPREWFGGLKGARVLGLASGGGQQGPVLAAAGAEVTVFDASPAQLSRDQAVSEREGLGIRTELGDMADLGRFAGASFDLVFHPCSNCFVPAIRPVWKEAARVLRPGGRLLAGFCLPALFLVDEELDEKGEIVVRYKIPYSDAEQLAPDLLKKKLEHKVPLSFGHPLSDQLGGQLDAGLLLAGYYEDSWEPGLSALSDRIPTFAATLALKPI